MGDKVYLLFSADFGEERFPLGHPEFAHVLFINAYNGDFR